MKTVDETLAAWRAARVSTVKLSVVKTHADLQMRSDRLSSVSESAQDTKSSQRQIEQFAAMLNADTSYEMEPLLVAKVDGVLFVVDGHHRRLAYQRARRQTMPARVMVSTMRDAAAVSVIVNLDQQKRTMTRGQYAETAWQWLAIVTGKGRMPLPSQYTYRSIAARHSVSVGTVCSMMNRMEVVRARIDAGDIPAEWMNSALSWPHWRDVRSDNRWKDSVMTDVETRQQRKVERCAHKLAALRDQFTDEIYRKALAALDVSEETDSADAD